MWIKKKTRRKNPYDETPSNIHGLNSEKRVISDMGGTLQIGSGAIDTLKSDGVKDAGKHKLRIECKSTINKSISIKHEWLLKIRDEALETGRVPALTLSFVDAKGNGKVAGDWIALPAYFVNDLLDELVDE